jgi:hypothetical protein
MVMFSIRIILQFYLNFYQLYELSLFAWRCLVLLHNSCSIWYAISQFEKNSTCNDELSRSHLSPWVKLQITWYLWYRVKESKSKLIEILNSIPQHNSKIWHSDNSNDFSKIYGGYSYQGIPNHISKLMKLLPNPNNMHTMYYRYYYR